MSKEVFTNFSREELTDIIKESIQAVVDNLELNAPAVPTNLVKVKEACAFLQVSKATIFRWMNAGKVKGYYLGTRLYFKQDELEQALTLKQCQS